MNELTHPQLNGTENSASLVSDTKWSKVVKAALFSITFTPSKRKKVKKVNITLEGEIGITTVAEIKPLLEDCIAEHDVIDLNLKNISAIDLTGIQLLFLLSQKNPESRASVTIDSELNKEDLDVMKTAGFHQLIIKPKLTT